VHLDIKRPDQPHESKITGNSCETSSRASIRTGSLRIYLQYSLQRSRQRREQSSTQQQYRLEIVEETIGPGTLMPDKSTVLMQQEGNSHYQ